MGLGFTNQTSHYQKILNALGSASETNARISVCDESNLGKLV